MKCKIKDIANVTMGQSPESIWYNSNGEGIPFLQGNRTFGDKYPTFDTWTKKVTKVGEPNSVIMSVRAPVGDIKIIKEKVCLWRGVCSIQMKNGNQEFLYYLLKYVVNDIKNRESGTVFGSINRKDIEDIIVEIPKEIKNQIKISNILKEIDDKIELNNKINKNLEEQALLLFKSFFIDFYQNNGLLPNNWSKYKLSDFLPVITGKKNANCSSTNGKYPFFSCSQNISWTNDYSFNGSAILVAGNGDFNVKFYKGKFEAYQRTYVLIPFDQSLTSFLFYVVKYNLNQITKDARGSVINFITKSDLDNLEFCAPQLINNSSMINAFNIYNTCILRNVKENSKLSKLRDSLMAKLMSGEIDVSKIDI